MARRRRSAAVAPDAPTLWQQTELSLRLHASGERLGALLKERERLLREVRRKKLALEQTVTRAQDSARDLLESVAPLFEKHETLVAHLRELFDELLAPSRLSASARKKVAKVRRTLEEQGLLGALETPPFEQSASGAESAASAGFEPPWADVESSTGGAFPREVQAASQPGQSPGRESLRTLFRRLARAVHPDHAKQEPERQQRTEAMKQVTQAYEDGDLARLLELEKAWQASAPLPAAGDDEERCRELERMIRELRAQSNGLQRELRQLKRSAPFPFFGMAADDLLAQAEAELKELETIRDFVESFRDGKISIAEFVAGPEFGGDQQVDLEAFIHEFVAEQLARPPRPERAQAPAKRHKARKRR